MILDSSAAVAVVIGEPGHERYKEQLRQAAGHIRMSAVSVYEAAVVIRRKKGPSAVSALYELIRAARIIVEPFGLDQARLSDQVYGKFGKGSVRSVSTSAIVPYTRCQCSMIPIRF